MSGTALLKTLVFLSIWKLNSGAGEVLHNATCTAAWSPWSKCFPGTTSDPTPYKDRVLMLVPSQKDANDCNTTSTVLEVQVELDCTTTDMVVSDLTDANLKNCEFQCGNGLCIGEHFKCNGDDDCGDSSDEYPQANCSLASSEYTCGVKIVQSTSQLAPKDERYFTGIPGIDAFASGYDILTGNFRGAALSMAPHGSCRKVLVTGGTDSYYRLPQNVASYRQLYDVVINNVKLYQSAGAILNTTRDAFEFNLDFAGNLLNVDGRTGLTQSTSLKDMVTYNIENDEVRTYVSQSSYVDTAAVKLQDPTNIELSGSFVSRVMMLPYSSFSYSKYLQLIEDFGTHYVAESKMGGIYDETNVFSRCWLDSKKYQDYSDAQWKNTIMECTREQFFNGLQPTPATISDNCQFKDGADTKLLQDETLEQLISVRGGSVETSSDLKFSFSKTTWDAWVQSISMGPVLNTDQFKIQRISKLMKSPSIPFGDNARQQAVMNFIDQAIDMYLGAYDATALCAPCGVLTNDGTDDNGLDTEVKYYGVPYVTGTSTDYKCMCSYGAPPKLETCGSSRVASLFSTILFSIILTLWVMFS